MGDGDGQVPLNNNLQGVKVLFWNHPTETFDIGDLCRWFEVTTIAISLAPKKSGDGEF